MTLDLCQNFVSAQYLENYSIYFHQILYMHVSWQNLAWDCYKSFFSEICTRVMALYLRQNFFSTQYLENQLVEFHQVLYMHSSWQYLALDSYMLFFANLYQSYGP